MHENITLETVYVNEGVLYKTPLNNLSEVNGDVSKLKVLNLSNNEESTYPTLQTGEVVSVKNYVGSLTTKTKLYTSRPNQDLMDFTSDYMRLQSVGVIDDFSEKYFSLENPLGLEELSINYALPMPVTGALLDDFTTNFKDWVMSSAPGIILASVKFDVNNNPILLKLYRGNYTPTDLEIQEAKAYWEL
jgi:Leucine-rich repeat (LRR) protein